MAAYGLALFLQLPQGPVRVLHFRQKQVHIEPLQLLSETKVFPGGCGLLFQRLHLLFQLSQNIGDPDQVLFFILQLFLGNGLSPLEFYDPGGLIEQLSPLLRPPAQDLIDLALADDGIAFFSDSRIIKQLIDIL